MKMGLLSRYSRLCLLASVLLTALLKCVPVAFAEDGNHRPPLEFRDDGSFKILVVADIHIGNTSSSCTDLTEEQEMYPCSDKNTTAFIRRLLKKEKPDFVVYDGDIISGADGPNQSLALDFALEPLIEGKYKFAAVLGNHDQEGNLDRRELITHLSEKPNSYTQRGPTDIYGEGNYFVQIVSRSESELESLIASSETTQSKANGSPSGDEGQEDGGATSHHDFTLRRNSVSSEDSTYVPRVTEHRKLPLLPIPSSLRDSLQETSPSSFSFIESVRAFFSSDGKKEYLESSILFRHFYKSDSVAPSPEAMSEAQKLDDGDDRALQNDKTKGNFTLWFLDSGDYDKFDIPGTYDWIRSSQITWYNETTDQLRKAAGVSALPSLAFFHIPVPEFSLGDSKSYVGVKQESVQGPNVNSGMLTKLIEVGDVKAVFVGHDHVNDYCNNQFNIQLCYTGGSSYHSYSRKGWPRRARLVELRDFGNEVWTWKRLDDENFSKIDEENLYDDSKERKRRH